jgi:predicted nuclease of predicted toxin-antitoxin system
VRLLLDAHVSGPRVGRALEAAGHHIRGLDQAPELEGLADPDVLALATEERRILVTHNIRDFPEIVREWMEAQRTHAGVILVYAIDHREFQLVTAGIERLLALHPEAEDWADLTVVLDRRFASG